LTSKGSFETGTFLAKFELLVVATVVTLFAAVAAIPVATWDVVVIVADTITLEFCDGTCWCNERRIQTCALKTVFILVHVASLATTVTAVPATGTVVVIVIAELVALVIVRTAFARAIVFFVYRRIKAQTILTITELAKVVSITAVALVPRAFDVIVRIVAESVAHVF